MALMLCAALALGIAPLGARAEDTVTYIERSWDGSEVVSETKTAAAVPVPADGSMTSGTYLLGSDVTVDSRILLTGDTELILGDGFTLTAKGLYIPGAAR